MAIDMTKKFPKYNRKEDVKKIKDEGRQAARDGRHPDTCPPQYMHNMDRYQWMNGYFEEVELMESEEDATK